MLKQGNCNSFAIFLIILLHFANCRRHFKNMESENKESSDFNRDFTNSEIELALSDLSLPDLNTLQEFIDSSDNNNDYNYADNSFLNSNSKTSNFYNLNTNQNFNLREFDNIETDTSLNKYKYVPQQDTFQDMIYFQRPPDNLMKFSTENQRSKRGDHQQEGEYLKQLDESFSRNLEQSNNNDKKDHIRVKRN